MSKLVANCNDGQYFYSYSSDCIFVDPEKDGKIKIEFTQSTIDQDRFKMVSFLCSDVNCFDQIKIRDHHLSVNDIGPMNMLITTSVIVEDTKTGDLINCDPQVLNRGRGIGH